MKTAQTVAAQEERKSAGDNGEQGRESPELTPPVRPKLKQRDASRIAAWRWQPGKSANPGGVPKHDVAKEIAKAIFLNNPEMIYKAYCKMLKRGNAYAFQVLSDRAFGKLKEHYEVEAGPFRDLTEDELRERIAKLEEQLGVLPEHIEPDDTKKPN